MKQFSANRKSIKMVASKETAPAFTNEIFADSLEVMESYCQQKIVLLQSALEKLNILEDALEIISVCQQIKREKKMLKEIVGKYE
ncbi:MAG: hypothetical protein EOO01_22050 [Chitinophagaceae bacterium]|nr:MAG: hypothetical protein EOO01_22050 [Chitinophagaceae bacterium]